MKVGIFNTSKGGAARFAPYFAPYPEELQLIDLNCDPSPENLDIVRETGCEALLYFQHKRQGDEFYRKLSETGVRFLCTHSAGYDHFNLEAMAKYGIKGANVPFYSPNAIAEHTILMTLSVLRNLREQVRRIDRNDFTLNGLMGRELRNCTVGVVGTGRIGCVTIRCLSGFGPRKILAYAPHPRGDLRDLAEYVSLETLYRQSDILLFHCAANDSNVHMVNEQTLKQMKDGVILINTARGILFDTAAVLAALRSGKIGGLGLDVIEEEAAFQSASKLGKEPDPILTELLSDPRVLLTSHSAFYTDEAFRNLNTGAVENLLSYARTGSCEFELT